MQFQADILDLPLIKPTVTETTAFGAALLAGIAIGLWTEENYTSLSSFLHCLYLKYCFFHICLKSNHNHFCL